MSNLDLLRKQLQRERSRVQTELANFNKAIAALSGVTEGARPGRRISAAGRARIAAAQRARWAGVKGRRVAADSKHGRRKLSRAAIARIKRAQRVRWAKWRQGKKSRLGA